MAVVMQLLPRAVGSSAQLPISSKQIPPQLNDVFPLDEAVFEVLPPGISFLSIEHFGVSTHAMTGRLITGGEDGSEKPYFLKVAYGEQGRVMLNGEFESSKDIHRIMSDFIPRPFGFGRYRNKSASAPATYFYVSEFVDMDVSTAPDPGRWGELLARFHRASVSPNGKFGYHVTTCDGRMPHTVDWEENWAKFYRRLLLGVCKLDLETNGPWPELELATRQVTDVVVPRLLETLQRDGRFIKPSLIHGDLWEGNIGINNETGNPVVFDASSYFAHNEMELGHWRCESSSVFGDRRYIQHYLKYFPAAEPVDEFDDRVRLYSIKRAMNYAAGHPGSSRRRIAYNDMCYLIEKYTPIKGIDKYDPNIDPDLNWAQHVPHVTEELM